LILIDITYFFALVGAILMGGNDIRQSERILVDIPESPMIPLIQLYKITIRNSLALVQHLNMAKILAKYDMVEILEI